MHTWRCPVWSTSSCRILATPLYRQDQPSNTHRLRAHNAGMTGALGYWRFCPTRFGCTCKFESSPPTRRKPRFYRSHLLAQTCELHHTNACSALDIGRPKPVHIGAAPPRTTSTTPSVDPLSTNVRAGKKVRDCRERAAQRRLGENDSRLQSRTTIATCPNPNQNPSRSHAHVITNRTVTSPAITRPA